MSLIIDSLAKLAEKFSQKYPGEASGLVELDANARIASDQAFSTGGSDTHKPMGVIESNITSVAKAESGVLMTYTLPTNTLDVDGKAVRVTAWGIGTASNNVTINFRIGGTVISSLALTATDIYWRFSILIVRTGSSAQAYISELFAFTSGGAISTPVGVNATTAKDLATALALDVNLSSWIAGTVTQKGMLVELLN